VPASPPDKPQAARSLSQKEFLNHYYGFVSASR